MLLPIHPATSGSSKPVFRALKRIAHRAEVEDVNPHALRHTFATRYLDANPGDLRGLAQLLGHASLHTIMIYTEPDLNDLADRLERMERGRWGAAEKAPDIRKSPDSPYLPMTSDTSGRTPLKLPWLFGLCMLQAAYPIQVPA